MKKTKVLKIFAYIFIFILPVLIAGNITYMAYLTNNEDVLSARDMYESSIFQGYFIDELYRINNDIKYNQYSENKINDYLQIRFYNSNNNLIDAVIIDETNKKIYTNIDIFEEEKKQSLDSFMSSLIEQKAYEIKDFDPISNVNEIETNEPSIEESKIYRQDNVSNKDLISIIEELYKNGENSIIYSNKEITSNSSYINDDTILKEIDNIITVQYNQAQDNNYKIYLKVTENKPFQLYLIQLFYGTAKAFGRFPTIFIIAFFSLYIACLIYVLSKAGHKDNSEELHMNNFDKIPFDVVTIIFGIIIFLIFVIAINIWEDIQIDLLNQTELYLLITSYILVYIIVQTMLVSWTVTIAKRIKDKSLAKNNLIVKCIKFIFKILKKIFRGIKNLFKNFFMHFGLNVRTIAMLFTFTAVSIFLSFKASREGFCVILLLVLWAVAVVLIIRQNTRFKEIKNALKQIYSGETDIELKENRYKGELKEISHYINNISDGFSKAIEDGVKSEKMKAELITNVSHDIKTPLTSIINYVDLIKKEDIKNEKVKEYIEILDSKSQRLKRLTEDLVEASKASSGNLNLEITKINLEELINQAIGEFEEKFEEKKLEIIFNVKKEKIRKADRVNQTKAPDRIDKLGKIASINKIENLYINADSKYMFRIIENLFGNIYKYALENSRVYIDIESVDNTVTISIKNISKEKLNVSEEELMQRFVRGDKARTTEGSGLGLSIAKSLTELQNGKFELIIDGDLFKVNLTFNLVY